MAVVTAINGAALHALVKQRMKPGESLYGVVDAARDKTLAFAGATRFGWPIRWLFSEDTHQQMKDVAPYLVPIPFEAVYPYVESDYLDLWAEHLWRNAGILVLSSADVDTLWKHLNGIFEVAEGDGERYYFRFYDPRVLREILPGCTGDHVREQFGPMSHLLVEAEAMGCMLTCRPAGGEVEIVESLLTVDTTEA